MNTMEIDTKGRILGSFLIVTAYFVVLHISATIGALMHLIANVISLPFFIRTKAHDVEIMLTFLMVISLSKLLWTQLQLHSNLSQIVLDVVNGENILCVLIVNQLVKYIILVGQDYNANNVKNVLINYIGLLSQTDASKVSL